MNNTIANILKDKGLCGLVNFGNTCYMNSAIQCLSNTFLLTEYIFTNNFKSNNVLINEWKKLLKGLYHENCVVSPISFLKTIINIANEKDIEFAFSNQNDVSEFLVFFIDQLHEEIKRKVSITISGSIINNKDKMAFDAMTQWKSFFKNNYSEIINIFYGQLVSRIYVTENNNYQEKSSNYSPICFFNLSIPQTSNETDIYDCFDLFTQNIELNGDNKWKCDKTNNYYDAIQNIKIWKFPSILIINLKRFNNSRRKIKKLIDFPIDNLDLRKYCEGYDAHKSIFNLYAICNHSGNLNSGHYYAYCKNLNNKWYKYNDRNVSLLDESNIVTSNAYCLFYKKINN